METFRKKPNPTKIMKEDVRMSKAGVKFEDIETRLMKDEEFKAEYEKLKPRYELIAQIINAHNKLKIHNIKHI